MTCEHDWFDCGPFKVCLKCQETTKFNSPGLKQFKKLKTELENSKK